MSPLYQYDVIAAINFFVSMAICAIAICRSGKLQQKETLFRVRIQYVILAPVAFANAAAPALFQEYSNKASLCFAIWVLVMLLLDGWQWKHGAPKSVKTSFGDLPAEKEIQ